LRKGQKIHEGAISGLRHFQEDVRELSAPQECGVMLEGFREFEEGDVIESYRSERQP
jgi:translation initiation factor IF-2